MTVDEFVKGYDKFTSDDAKVKYIKKHIVSDYVPYIKKINEAQRIIKASTYRDDRFHLNTPARYMLTMVSVATMYLGLEFDSTNMVIEFDMLEKRGINDMFQGLIGVDYNRFLTLISMVYDDEIMNTRDLISFLETGAEAFGTTFQAVISAAEEGVDKNGETDVI